MSYRVKIEVECDNPSCTETEEHWAYMNIDVRGPDQVYGETIDATYILETDVPDGWLTHRRSYSHDNQYQYCSYECRKAHG